MDANEIDALLRAWRKKPLPLGAVQALEFGLSELECLLPHRKPFLLIDRLIGLSVSTPLAEGSLVGSSLMDSPEGLIIGQRYIDPQDPILAGHFPSFPIYPGVLQLEMLGQLALCLDYFQEFLSSNKSSPIQAPNRQQELNIRASKILGAYYLRPVLPGKTVELRACQLGQSDGLVGRMFGQTLVDGQVATVCAQEVCFLD